MSPTVIDLFAGPGGWDEGLRMIGVTDVLGIEFEKNACATAEAAGHQRLLADIATLQPSSIAYSITGLIGSPPCPGFSAAGKGLGRQDFDLLLWAIDQIGRGSLVDETLDAVRAQQNDERSALTLEPLRWVLALDPEWIALEQVPTVLPLWEAYATVLRLRGYSVWTGNLQAEQYGVPQTRKRAVLIASRTVDVDRPVPTHSRYYPRTPDKLDEGVEKWVSMAEALVWDDAEGHMRSNYGTGGDPTKRGERLLSQPAPTVTSKVDRNKWRFAGAGQTSEQSSGQIPRHPDQPAHTITGKGTAAWVSRPDYMMPTNDRPNVAKRSPDAPAPTMAFGHERPRWCWNRPSTTIVGSFKPEIVAALSRQNAPDSVRVTVEEAGILQSFPADYPWQGTKGKQFQQVGNAVPPLLAAHVLAALGVGELNQEAAA